MRPSGSRVVGGPRAGFAAIAMVAVIAGCGGGGGGSSTAAPSPTPDTPDKGECVNLTGPDDDVEITVVDCAGAQYEVVRVIGRLLLPDEPCPPETDVELDQSIQFLRPGQTAGPGGMETKTFCLATAGKPSSPSAAPPPSPFVGVTADDVTYTSKSGLGDPMTVTFALDNASDADSPPIIVELSGLSDHADAERCTPSCGIAVQGDVQTLTFADGLTAGSSAEYEIELVTSQAGSVTWRLTIYAGAANSVFTGTGTTEIE